jgi:hypothetical protein
MPTTELFVAARHIYGQLAGTLTVGNPGSGADVTGIFRDAADENAPFPYAVYQYQSGQDIMAGMGAVRDYAQLNYLVRLITSGRSTAPVEAAAAKVSTGLHRSTSQTADGNVLSCLREAEGDRFGIEAGVEWSEVWERFQLLVQAN